MLTSEHLYMDVDNSIVHNRQKVEKKTNIRQLMNG